MASPERIDELRSELEALVPGGQRSNVELIGDGSFESAFRVDDAILSAASAAVGSFGATTLDRSRVLAMCSGQVLVDGQPVAPWAELSGYYETADGGTMQLHCNFEHHGAGVVAELACAPTREAVQGAILRRDPVELESTLISSGMIAARLRTLKEWDAHPHARATEALPLISIERLGDAPPRRADRQLRVLDCSRVLAGPIAGLTFAAHNADVLRIGAPNLPSVEIGVLSTGSGKRNANVDLATPAGRSTMRNLLKDTDVWIDAYRPGALAGRGFGTDAANPGSVTVQLCAFDTEGPWAGRRGFDSIVQSTTGIVLGGTTAAGVDEPTPLPVQALDYATGLLAAFAARRLIDHQSVVGGTWLAKLSLLRCRNWLVGLGGPQPFVPSKPAPAADALHTVHTSFGAVTTAKPLSGAWAHGPERLGSSPPVWR